jgi:Sir2- and TIR-associating SLOG family/SIR2-like domain
MHGDVDNPNQAILIKDDYEKYHETHAPFVTALSGDLVSKTFLFLGFSFTDPNLDYVLSRIRINLDKNQREHFCILKHVPETEADFEYKRIRQKHFIADLKRFNIKTLLVKEYAEITDILRKIELSYRMNTVFISGSAHEYGDMGEKRALDFVHELSKRLIKEDLTVVSGFGMGIGSAIINGVLEQLREQNTESLDERLVLRPFPQRQTGETPIPVQWDRYRREMIPLAGIALFLFGNKFVGDKVVLADGMRKEFDIAIEHELKILPVGATGYVADALWNEVKGKFEDYYAEPLREPFLALGDSTLTDEQLIDKIVSTIRVLKRG